MGWTIAVKDSYGSWLNQDNVQTIGLEIGRKFLIDSYGADRLVYSGRISSAPYPVVMGATIVCDYDAYGLFYGRITNVAIRYGKVPNEDIITVTAESQIAELGRTEISGLVLSSTSIADQINAIASDTNINIYATVTNSLAKTQTYTGNALTLVNQLIATEFGYLRDEGEVVGIEFVGRDQFVQGQTWIYSFTDDNPTGYEQAYDELEFTSAADNYWTDARVEPDGLAAQETTSAASVKRVLVVQTLDQNTTQALAHAQYLQGLFNQQGQTIAAISATNEMQSTSYLPSICQPQNVGKSIDVTFRGTTYTCVIQGMTISARPGETRYTLHVTPADLTDYLILDSPTFGKLDSNRLGF